MISCQFITWWSLVDVGWNIVPTNEYPVDSLILELPRWLVLTHNIHKVPLYLQTTFACHCHSTGNGGNEFSKLLKNGLLILGKTISWKTRMVRLKFKDVIIQIRFCMPKMKSCKMILRVLWMFENCFPCIFYLHSHRWNWCVAVQIAKALPKVQILPHLSSINSLLAIMEVSQVSTFQECLGKIVTWFYVAENIFILGMEWAECLTRSVKN